MGAVDNSALPLVLVPTSHWTQAGHGTGVVVGRTVYIAGQAAAG